MSAAVSGMVPVDDVGAIQANAGGYFSLVGVTSPLDEARYPGLSDSESRCDTIVGEHVTVSKTT